MPLANCHLHALVYVPGEIVKGLPALRVGFDEGFRGLSNPKGFGLCVKFEKTHEGAEVRSPGGRGVREALDDRVQPLALFRAMPEVRLPPGTFQKQIVVVLMLGEVVEDVPLLQLLGAYDPMILPQHVLSWREWEGTGSCLDLRGLVQLLRLVPHANLLVR